MQEWARGEERSCCDLHRRNSEMVKTKRCRELQFLPDPARDRLPPSATQNRGFSERGH
jgi:hypothetical protein